jgi:hypothetical protein
LRAKRRLLKPACVDCSTRMTKLEGGKHGAPAKVAIPLIVLQNSKMRGRQNFVARPSKRIFGKTMPRIELTKAAGWKSDSSCDPLHSFRASAPVPLEKFAPTPKRSFATQSPSKRTFGCDAISVAMGRSRHFALRKNSEPLLDGTTRIFMTVWSSSGELQNQIDAAKARGLPQIRLLPSAIVRRSAIRAAQPATHQRRTGQKTDRATSRCRW